MEVVAHQTRGEFILMNKSYHGQFDRIKKDVNVVSGTLNGIVDELNTVCLAMGIVISILRSRGTTRVNSTSSRSLSTR